MFCIWMNAKDANPDWQLDEKGGISARKEIEAMRVMGRRGFSKEWS